MKKTLAFSITFVAIVVVAYLLRDNLNRTGEVPVTNFDECLAAGNPVMESYPRQCRHGNQTYVEETPPSVSPPQGGEEGQTVTCRTEQRDAEVCTFQYEPVCASVQVYCKKAPCDPVQQTFSNPCEACKNSRVQSYTPGEC